jgi:shikimate kinase
VATGGGTFVDPENRAAINRDGLSVWLDVPLETVIERLPRGGVRPLAADRAQFERLYAVRRAAYQQARVRVDGAREPTDGLVEQIVAAMDA